MRGRGQPMWLEGASLIASATLLTSPRMNEHLFERRCVVSVPKFVTELNKEFAVVLRGNQAKIAYFEPGKPVRFIDVNSFKTLVANRLKSAAFDGEDTGKAWLNHPMRREYKEVVFAPGVTTPPHVLNLWRGFATVPRQGDVTPFLELVDALCG